MRSVTFCVARCAPCEAALCYDSRAVTGHNCGSGDCGRSYRIKCKWRRGAAVAVLSGKRRVRILIYMLFDYFLAP